MFIVDSGELGLAELRRWHSKSSAEALGYRSIESTAL